MHGVFLRACRDSDLIDLRVNSEVVGYDQDGSSVTARLVSGDRVTGSLLIEQVFSLDGLGYLSYESLINRDYPVVLGTLYIFALVGLVVNLLSDLTYTLIDPRIDFETREV